MAEQKDIRWIQRFNNYKKALAQLSRFIEKKELNEMEKQGLIKAFEYTYELSWLVLKNYLEFQGETGVAGSRDAFRFAFRRELLKDGEKWMQMIESHSKTAHTYNEDLADEIAVAIREKYYPLFISLEMKMGSLLNN